MNRFVVACAFVACVTGAPSNIALSNLGYAGVGAGAGVGPAVAHAPAVVGQTHHSYAADQPLLRTELNTESLDREPSRPVLLPLLPVTSTLLPDMRPSPSQPPLMLPEPHRTSSRPEPSPPQPSQLPQHLMLPSRDPPQLIP